MLMERTKKEFNLQEIGRGYALRFHYHEEQQFRMGLVVKADATRLRVVYAHGETGAIAYVDILARDVALGIWTIYYTRDLQQVFYEGKGELEGNSSFFPTSPVFPPCPPPEPYPQEEDDG